MAAAGSRPASRCRFARRRSRFAATRSRPGSMPRIRREAFCPRPAAWSIFAFRPRSDALRDRDRGRAGRCGEPVLRPDAGQDRGARRRPAGGIASSARGVGGIGDRRAGHQSRLSAADRPRAGLCRRRDRHRLHRAGAGKRCSRRTEPADDRLFAIASLWLLCRQREQAAADGGAEPRSPIRPGTGSMAGG